MKVIKKLSAIIMIFALSCVFMCVGVSAGDTQPTGLETVISGGTAVLANQQSTVSGALEVIA